MTSRYTGIAGLEGRDPIGVVLSIGKKKDGTGFPIERDRFHLVQPREESGVRHPHPAYAAFNAAAPEKRCIVRGNLVHANRADCFSYNLRAQVLDRKAHPDRRPCCEGDGKHAIRWTGPGPDDFTKVQCPNKLCPYSQGDNPPCKPFARLLFRLRWPEGNPLPCLLAKYTTGAWNTTANLVGFFDYIEGTARQLGMADYKLFGFPFVLTLTQQTRPSQKTKFPVVTISPDDVDPIAFFASQVERRQALTAYQPETLIEATPEVEYEDVRSISRGGADLPPAVLCDGSGLIPVQGSVEARECPGCSMCAKRP